MESKDLSAPLPLAPAGISRRQFVAGGFAAAVMAGCSDKKNTPEANTGFTAPIDNRFQFIRQIPQSGRYVADTSVTHFKDLTSALAGKPFTLSFMTSLCTAPVEGKDMLCDKMGQALGKQAAADPNLMHVVIAALPGGDYAGGLWGTLASNGLTEKNTIVLFPTLNGKANDLAMDGKLAGQIQNALELPNDSATNPSSHNAAISYYSATGQLRTIRTWRDVLKSPLSQSQSPSR